MRAGDNNRGLFTRWINRVNRLLLDTLWQGMYRFDQRSIGGGEANGLSCLCY